MFERYTEAARRTLFFARYEVSELGAQAIEPEHVLLGLLRAGNGPADRIFDRADLSLESVRTEIQALRGVREKIAQSVEIPFSAGTQRVLQYAAEEADRLLHSYIGTEHLLLALLREERSLAASMLTGRGLTLDGARQAIVQLLAEAAQASPARAGEHGGLREEINAIRRRVDALGLFHVSDDHARELIARILRDLDELKRRLG